LYFFHFLVQKFVQKFISRNNSDKFLVLDVKDSENFPSVSQLAVCELNGIMLIRSQFSINFRYMMYSLVI